MPQNSEESLRRVNIVRFVLPIVLFIIVVFYEGSEHFLLRRSPEGFFNFNMEVMFFGILGPTAVFVAFSYLMQLLRKQIEISMELEELNKNLEEIVEDRTVELKARNAELASANAELLELDQLKSDFVSLVSHELRGPLTTLNGGLEMALENAEELPTESRRVLEVMAGESQRLMHFVQAILDVSKLEAGKIEFTPGPVAILPLLKRASEVVFTGDERPIIWDVPRTLPPAWADESYTEQIVCNLLTNAGKYSPPGTPIVIEAKQNQNYISVSVTDQGPGIPQENQGKIFDRFVRLERGDQINSKGWGLGLYFSSALVEAQGGNMVVLSPVHPSKSAPGSTFKFTLPLAEETPEDD